MVGIIRRMASSREVDINLAVSQFLHPHPDPPSSRGREC